MNKEEIAKSIDEGLKILKQEPSFIFNLEEIKAIKRLEYDIELVTFNDNLNYGLGNLYTNINDLKILLNLISKLQKELDSQKQGNKDLVKEGVKLSAKIVELQKELDKKDKVINLIAEDRAEISEPKVSKEAIIDYYFKKVEEENENR